jgi:hypothetical protein
MNFLVTEVLNNKCITKFIVIANSAKEALNKLKEFNHQETLEGEPFLHTDSEIFAEPLIEFQNDICMI